MLEISWRADREGFDLLLQVLVLILGVIRVGVGVILFRDLIFNDPGESEIAYLDGDSFLVDENIGGLEVAVDDVGRVQVF